MKKYFLLISLLLSSYLQAADYTWVGGDASGNEWSNIDNWNIKKGEQGKIPNIADIGPFNNKLLFDAVKVSVPIKIDLWESTIKLTNKAHVTLNDLWKIQKATIEIEQGSTLDIGCSSGIFFNMTDDLNWKIFGTLNITNASANYSGLIYVSLGRTGIIHLKGARSIDPSFRFTLSLPKNTSKGGTTEAMKRVILTGSAYASTNNVIKVNNGTRVAGENEWNQLDKSSPENLGKYFIEKNNDSLIIHYVGLIKEAQIKEASDSYSILWITLSIILGSWILFLIYLVRLKKKKQTELN